MLGYKATKPQVDAVWNIIAKDIVPGIVEDAKFKVETWKNGKTYAVIRDKGRFVKRILLSPDKILRVEEWATGQYLIQRDKLGRFVKWAKL